MATVLTLAQAQRTIDQLSEHNRILADQAERLEGEVKESRKQRLEDERTFRGFEELFDELERVLLERIKALETRVQALEKTLE